MVQLKEVSRPQLQDLRERFQFLMVQLKEPTLPKERVVSAISIPYGSIKS